MHRDTNPDNQNYLAQAIDNDVSSEYIDGSNLERMISSFGNHENKSLLLLAMKEGEIYGAKKLKKLFDSLQGDEPAWNINPATLLDYCGQSLAPVGLVARTEVDEDGGWGYAKTELGSKFGDVVAAQLLEFSLRNPEVSLIDIFGRTSTAKEGGSRAPSNRLKFFEELLTCELPIEPAVIYERVLHDKYNPGFFDELSRNGIITYKPRGNFTGSSFNKYAINSAKLDVLAPSKSAFVNKLYELLRDWDIETPIDSTALLAQVCDESTSKEDRAKLQINVLSVIKRLKVKGVLTSEDDSANRSQVSLSSDQYDMLADLINTIYLVQSGQSSDTDLTGRSRDCWSLVDKAKENSTVTSEQQRNEQREKLLSAFVKASAPLTFQAVYSGLEGSFSEPAARRRLNELQADGGVTVSISDDGSTIYTINTN